MGSVLIWFLQHISGFQSVALVEPQHDRTSRGHLFLNTLCLLTLLRPDRDVSRRTRRCLARVDRASRSKTEIVRHASLLFLCERVFGWPAESKLEAYHPDDDFSPTSRYALRRGSLHSALRSERRLAEREGFEPSIPFWSMHAFQACAFNHSAISPTGNKTLAASAV